jgi:carbon storage regulator
MLVLSRKRTESIQIGDDVLVTVLEICGNRVRIGIEAPKAIPVHRSEVSTRIIGLPSRPPPCKGKRL